MNKGSGEAFTGILKGWDPLIRDHYRLQHSITTITAARDALKVTPDLPALFEKLYERIEANFTGGTPSAGIANSNWQLVQAEHIDEKNDSLEKRLEKRVVSLAASEEKEGQPGGPMAGWYNQMPAASGYADPYRNRKNSIDLVHECDPGKEYAFVELKCLNKSGSPFYATYEILSYGFLYLFTTSDRRLQERFEPVLDKKAVLKAKTIRLVVLAPKTYYQESGQTDAALTRFQSSINHALSLFAEIKMPGLSMSFEFRRFTNDVSSKNEIDRFQGFHPAPDGDRLSFDKD